MNIFHSLLTCSCLLAILKCHQFYLLFWLRFSFSFFCNFGNYLSEGLLFSSFSSLWPSCKLTFSYLKCQLFSGVNSPLLPKLSWIFVLQLPGTSFSCISFFQTILWNSEAIVEISMASSRWIMKGNQTWDMQTCNNNTLTSFNCTQTHDTHFRCKTFSNKCCWGRKDVPVFFSSTSFFFLQLQFFSGVTQQVYRSYAI